MYYSDIKFLDSGNGDGVRVSLWISGCRNHCKGCFNRDTWDFNFGKKFDKIAENEIIEACKKPYISGLTILGGEPGEPENQIEILNIIEHFKKECPDKTIWLFTGYVYEKDLLQGQRKNVENVTDRIMENVDILVDGPFIFEQRDLSLKFRGSSNQRLLTREDRITLQ